MRNMSTKVCLATLKIYPDIMNIDELCDALSISTKTGYRLIHQGKIEAIKVGRSYRIPKLHLLRYLRLLDQP